MYDIIVKQGFVVIVGFCYSICLFKNPVIMILKVIGCENCVRENKITIMGEKPSACKQFLQFFFGKNSHFNANWITFELFLTFWTCNFFWKKKQSF